MKDFLKKSLLIFLLIISFFIFAETTLAVDAGLNEVSETIALSGTDPRVIASRIIQIFLGFLGVIAVGLIVYGGFLWMTSEGDETKVDKAKTLLKNAVIGLAIILMSFAIATFILNRLMDAIGVGSSQPGGSGPGSDAGIGSVGSCTVESVYPESNQKNVARNTSIIVTFKESIDPTSVCDDVNNDGVCNIENILDDGRIRIYQSNDDKDNFLKDVKVSVTNNNKTFVFMPANYLGSPSESIWYSVYISNDIRKQDGGGIFTTCLNDYLLWNFEVSSLIDLTPPQVLSGGVFPEPDNLRDSITATNPTQATGSIRVISIPNTYLAASVSSVSKYPTDAPWSNATAQPYSHLSESGTFIVSVVNGTSQARLSKDGVSLGIASIVNNSVKFDNYFTLNIASSDFEEGSSWSVQTIAEQQADNLRIDNDVYVFVSTTPIGNQIQIASNTFAVASNIGTALTASNKVEVSVDGDRINLTAKVAGQAGNNIVVTTTSDSLSITSMTGGSDGNQTAIVNDKKDKPRNAVIQINFNEAINPLTVSGDSYMVQDAIKVINIVTTRVPTCSIDSDCQETCFNPKGLANGGVCVEDIASSGNSGDTCTTDIDCKSFNCENPSGQNNAGKCLGDSLLGKFVLSNQYRTVEFVSDNECGVNGCGEKIYCLPENSFLMVQLLAAQADSCATSTDCINRSPYTICDSSDFNCQDADDHIYPLADIELMNGVMDIAMNSLDGNRNGYFDGRLPYFIENFSTSDPKDSYVWAFYINNKIELDPPIITETIPGNEGEGADLTQPITIVFDKLMMSSSLKSGSVDINNGQSNIEHKLINIWSLNERPVGYWIVNEGVDDSSPLDGVYDFTKAQIKHSVFYDSVSYKTQIGSGVRDIYQNCFKPSQGPACTGVNQSNPSCCSGVITDSLDENGNCQ